MADTQAASGLTPEQWDDQFFTEYFQENRFRREMGSDSSSIIQVKEDLSKKKGDRVTIALVNRLSNSAVTGSSTMEGNEEDMTSRSHSITVDKYRNAVRVAEIEEQYSAISLRKAGKAVLKDWSLEFDRDQVIAALASINGVAYGTASEAQKDAWLVDNADRVLFGAAKSNNSSNDHSASLANIDNTADKATTGALALMKRIALSAGPKIRPVMDKGNGKRMYVAYCGSLTFRDLRDNSTLQQAQREVGLKMENSRLFEGGDLLWDNIIIKEIDDIAVLTGVGAGSIDVAPLYLCGQQALGYGIARRWRSNEETFDYGDKHGVEISQIYGVNKLRFGTGAGDTDDTKDHGIVTGFFAAVADS
jgi:N4-gp56 family major capsid protein